jgi:hypothetical protein
MKQQQDPVQKELIGLRQNKNEVDRQKLRKKVSNSSRFLDNYYNPKIHPKFWQSNGQFIEKRYL